MASAFKVVRNLYRDSVSLMQLSARLAGMPGIAEASAVMASSANLELLRAAGLFDGAIEAAANDLIIVVAGAGESQVADALAVAEQGLAARPAAQPAGAGAVPPRSLAMAVAQTAEANLALISTPGAYAGAEARKALHLGLNVMLFSDNVPLAEEVALKRLARRRGLLLMGPDCGTAIIDGVPLAFANAVRRGDIGCVAASGTGLQQVTCLIHRLGRGISQAIGTGGRDLSSEVGGLAMLQGIKALAADPDTRVMVLISKPPAPAVAERVLAAAGRAGKPVVVNFLGTRGGTLGQPSLHPAATLEEAAHAAVALCAGRPSRPAAMAPSQVPPRPGAGRRYVRGLFSGGTFCYEACLILKPALGTVQSNTPIAAGDALADPWTARGHTLLDLGDDTFTRGRPHPMIDHRLRNERLLREAADPEVGVILFDVVLGRGAHDDPAMAMEGSLAAARAASPGVVFVASVCGTDGDAQGLARQEQRLRAAGVVLASSNAAAARLAAAIIAAGGR
jgi:succinyl-CoA synthetase alpha subunit